MQSMRGGGPDKSTAIGDGSIFEERVFRFPFSRDSPQITAEECFSSAVHMNPHGIQPTDFQLLYVRESSAP
jgi:hypothetical protein